VNLSLRNQLTAFQIAIEFVKIETMRAFLIRFEERRTICDSKSLSSSLFCTQADGTISPHLTATKTFTEVKAETDDKDPSKLSFRAFQNENA
jgi:hypothetical protein